MVDGEKEIEICGRKFKARPSFRALVTIEEKAGCSLVKMLQRASKQDVRANDIAAILYGCFKASDPDFKMDYDDLGEMVYQHGVMEMAPSAISLVVDALAGQEKKTENMNP